MNLFKSNLRSLKHRKLLSFLRIMSLFIGAAVAFYILEYNKVEESYDTFWKDSERLYRISLQETNRGRVVSHSAKCYRGAPLLFRSELSGVESATYFGKDVITVFCKEKQYNDVNWLWADTAVFNVLDRDILQRNNDNIWGDLHGVTISESFARKLFGNSNPLGQRFTLNEGWEFFVSAVFEDVPDNSHIKMDVVGNFSSLIYYMRHFDNTRSVLVDNAEYQAPNIDFYGGWSWRQPENYRPYCYVKLAPQVKITDIKRQIPKAMEMVTLGADREELVLDFDFQKITDIHLTSNLKNEFKTNGSQRRVHFLYLLGIIVLLVSAINYINLSSMQSIESGKHFAVRLLNGAKVSSIIRYLLFENVIVALFSLLIAYVIVWLFSDFLGLRGVSIRSLLSLSTFLLIVSLFSAVYAYFSGLHNKFKIYLKSQSSSLNSHSVGRKLMVLMQFSVSIVLIVSTLMINRQLNYMIKSDLGFTPERTIYSRSPMSMNGRPDIPVKLNTFKNRVKEIPSVAGFCTSSSIPGREISRTLSSVIVEGQDEAVNEQFSLMSITDEYASLFSLDILLGQNFSTRPNWQSNQLIINKLAAEKLGFSSYEKAIGATLRYNNRDRVIVGVIENYHHESLKKELQAIIFEQNLTWDHAVGYYGLKISSDNMEQTITQITKIWEDIYPLETASFSFTDANFDLQYREDKKFMKVVSFCSLIAIFISCLGLLASALFDTRKRTREIGIRKVNGARISEILVMLNKDFIKWVIIAFILASPIAFFAMQKWLENFAYKTTLSWWIFLLAGGLALCIALFTVSFQSWKAATRNPVDALRYE